MTTTPRTTAVITRTRHAVREELAPLTHPSAFSWRVAVVFAAISGLAQLVYDARYTGTPITDWVMPTSVSVAVYFVVFAILGRLSRRRRFTSVQVLLCFTVAGSARTLSVGAVAMLLDVTESMDWAFRVSGGVLLSPALLVVIAIGVVRHDAHLAIVTELQDQRDHLVDVGRSVDDALTRTEDEITMAVRADIAPALDALDAVLDRVVTDASTQSAVAALSSLVDDEVRPISHRLATQERYVPTAIDRARHSRRAHVPLPSSIVLADGIRPVVAAMLFFSVAAPTVIRHSTVDAAIVRLLWGALVTWLVLTVLKVLLRPVRAPAVPAVVLVAGVHALAEMLTLPMLHRGWLALSQAERLVGVQVAALVGAMTTIAVVVDARRAATQSELMRVVAELNTMVEMMSRRARLASSRLAHVLHGSLQGALHAAAIRLNEATTPDAALVRAIRHDIAVALERLDDRTWGGADLQDTIDEIESIWSGRRTVTVTVAPEATSALSRNRDADAATAEVVRESVNNALRHGRARSVVVEVSMVDDGGSPTSERRCVQITVNDDGIGWSGDAQGLGTLLFDDLCTSWHKTVDSSGTCFVAQVDVLPLTSGGSVGETHGADEEPAAAPQTVDDSHPNVGVA